MELLFWTPLIYSLEGFPRDTSGTPYIPGSVLQQGINEALTYYYIKKDPRIENSVKRLLLDKHLKPDSVVQKIQELVLERYSPNFELPKVIKLNSGRIYETIVDIYDLKKWRDIDSLKIEVFEGIVSIDLDETEFLKIAPAAHSFANALLRMEMELLEDHPLVERYYQPLMNEVRRWEIPLRIGYWTQNPYQGNLLFFWRIKEVRERFLRDFRMDIRPTKILFLPREGVTPGWAELRKEV